MTTMTLEAIGFTKAELQEKLLDRLCSEVLAGVNYDQDGDAFSEDSDFAKKLNERVKAHIDSVVDAVAQKHVLPNVSQYIENLSKRHSRSPVRNSVRSRQGSGSCGRESVKAQGYSHANLNSSGSWRT